MYLEPGLRFYAVIYSYDAPLLCPGNDIEEGQLDEEEAEELSEQPSTTTALTESTLSTSVTSSGPVPMVSTISEQVSSVPVGGEDNPPPSKRRPEPIVWSGPSCECMLCSV